MVLTGIFRTELVRCGGDGGLSSGIDSDTIFSSGGGLWSSSSFKEDCEYPLNAGGG